MQFTNKHAIQVCIYVALSIGFFGHGAYAEKPGEKLDDTSEAFEDPIYNIPRVWGFMAAFDFDENEVRPAIIDIGIVNDGETRSGGSQCDVTWTAGFTVPANFNCNGPVNGQYSGILDGRVRHGTNMKNLLAATLNDIDDTNELRTKAGVAGQMATPNLYRFDEVHNYPFELYSTIDKAVADGSTAINISGGFPCRLKPFEAIDITTPDICSAAERTAIILALCSIPPLPADIFVHNLVCTLGAGSLIEGNIEALIQNSVTAATNAGIPIVASAGNVEDGLVGNLSGAVVGNSDIDDWKILPASLSRVIAVGAVSADAPYLNSDFHGSNVDVWAPKNDTSPSAAFVTGLISLAQAIDPDLHPDTTSSPLASLPVRLRQVLRDTAYTSAELTAMGHDDPTQLRRNLVNPYAFVKEIADFLLPNYAALGYSERFDTWVESLPAEVESNTACNPDHPEADGPDDQADAIPLNTSAASMYTCLGTVLHFPGNPDDIVDSDWYKLDYTGGAENDVYTTNVQLRYPTGFGSLELAAEHSLLRLVSTTEVGAETVHNYQTLPVFGGSELSFRVKGVMNTDDNIYQLLVNQPIPNTVQADVFEPNNNKANASLVTPSPAHNNISITEIQHGMQVGISGLNFHLKADQDFLRLLKIPFPRGDLLSPAEFEITASEPQVHLRVFGPTGILLVQGTESVNFLNIDNVEFKELSIRTKAIDPIVSANYNLVIRAHRDPPVIDPDISEKGARQLAELLNSLAEAPGDMRIREIGCLACNTLRESGEISLATTTHPLATDTRFNANVRAVQFLTLVEKSSIRIDVQSQSRHNDTSLELHNSRGLSIAQSTASRRGVSLKATLDEGVYLVTFSNPSSRNNENLEYRIVDESQRHR